MDSYLLLSSLSWSFKVSFLARLNTLLSHNATTFSDCVNESLRQADLSLNYILNTLN